MLLLLWNFEDNVKIRIKGICNFVDVVKNVGV